jgi:hypothetical protein
VPADTGEFSWIDSAKIQPPEDDWSDYLLDIPLEIKISVGADPSFVVQPQTRWELHDYQGADQVGPTWGKKEGPGDFAVSRYSTLTRNTTVRIESTKIPKENRTMTPWNVTSHAPVM